MVSRRSFVTSVAGAASLSPFASGRVLAVAPQPGASAVSDAIPKSSLMLLKRLEGRDEPILEPDLPIIDAHHHLVSRPGTRYLLDDYLEDVALGHNIVRSVYLEIGSFRRADGPENQRTLGEIEFANGIGAMGASGSYGTCKVASAIVGTVDLRTGDAAAAIMDEALQLAPLRMRGIRQNMSESDSEAPYQYMSTRPPRGLMKSTAFRAGFRHLASRDLSFDAAVFHTQLPELAAFVDAFPNTSFVLNHAGMPLIMDAGGAERKAIFDAWRDGMKQLARRPNVTCKIGGFGLPYWGFGFNERPTPIGYRELAAAWSPYIETSIEAFGANRCMMESNYPPDARSCGFVPLWNALKYVVRSYSISEKTALFSGTAARVYRISAPSS